MLEGRSEGGLVWERGKRMYVGEEVVDEKLKYGERADGFGIEDAV